MGWLFMSRWHMGGFGTPKAYLDNQCTYPPDPDNGRTNGLRVLKSVWSGSAYYAAVEPFDISGTAGEAFAVVCLVRWNPKARHSEHFGFKDMDESMGPCEARCPASVLSLLGKPRNDYAAEWRKRCWAWNALTRRPRPKPGDTLLLPAVITFTDGYATDRLTAVQWGSKLVFRGDNGGHYRLSRFMERPWTLIRAPHLAMRPTCRQSAHERAAS